MMIHAPLSFIPQAYLFDLDGTLIDTTPDIATAVNLLRVELSLPALSPSEVERGVGHGATHLLRCCLPTNLHPNLGEYKARFIELYEANLYVKTRPYPEVSACLERLKKLGVPIALVTNKPMRLTEPLLADLGWTELFDVVCGGDTYPQRKPSPMPILETLKKLGVPADQALFIGDTEVDAEAAQRAHVSMIAVPYGRVAAQINEGVFGASARVSSLSALPDTSHLDTSHLDGGDHGKA
jgi:phosphoglycolate phosphatase